MDIHTTEELKRIQGFCFFTFVGGMIRPSVEELRRCAVISIGFVTSCRAGEEFPKHLQKQAAVPVFSFDHSGGWLTPQYNYYFNLFNRYTCCISPSLQVQIEFAGGLANDFHWPAIHPKLFDKGSNVWLFHFHSEMNH